jgi:hypothetical protein
MSCRRWLRPYAISSLVLAPFAIVSLRMYTPTHIHSAPLPANQLRLFVCSICHPLASFAFVLFVRAMCCLLMPLGLSRTAARYVCCNSVLPSLYIPLLILLKRGFGEIQSQGFVGEIQSQEVLGRSSRHGFLSLVCQEILYCGVIIVCLLPKNLKRKEGVVSALPGPPFQKVVTASAQLSQFDCIAFTFLPFFFLSCC